jgi:deoxyribose-phosphate aldolase
MNIKQYLDSTYLKTAAQAGLSEQDNTTVVKKFVQEAIDEGFKLIMIRPDKVKMAREMIVAAKSKVLIGTVISFPEGTNSTSEKLEEAQKAIEEDADEIDFVCNYEAFKKGELELVKKEIYLGTQLAFEHHKVAKWIIEIAALTAFSWQMPWVAIPTKKSKKGSIIVVCSFGTWNYDCHRTVCYR